MEKGYKLHRYEQIKELSPDIILVTAPECHQSDIASTACNFANEGIEVVIFNGDTRQRHFG